MVYNAKISAFVSCLLSFFLLYTIVCKYLFLSFSNFLHSTYSISSTWRCLQLLFYLPTLLSFQRKTTVVLSSLRHSYEWVSVYHWTFICISNRRLNCGLTPCVYSIDCQAHPPTIFLCSGIMKLHTQTHGYPGIHSLRHIGGCTCTCEHTHIQTNINHIPLALCLQNKAVVCVQHNEVYLYCRVIHDSLSWCWTPSKKKQTWEGMHGK